MEPDRVEEGDLPRGRGGSERTGLIGVLVGLYWLLDGLVIGIPVVILAASLNPFIVFAVTAALLVPLNIAWGGWLDRHWDGWFDSNSSRVEKKLKKLRSGRVMRHPVKWVTSSSDAWFIAAAAVTSAITVVCLARVIGGQPLGRHRVSLAGVGYGLFCSGIWVLAGFLVGDAIQAA